MGVVVNLDEETVSLLGYVTAINDVDAAIINFHGKRIRGVGINVRGYVDRASGHLEATATTSDPKKRPYDPNIVTFHYDVLCKWPPTRFDRRRSASSSQYMLAELSIH